MSKDTSKLVDGVTIIPNKSSDFLRVWLEIMKPIHKLTPTEMDFTAVLLQKRYELAEKIEDPAIIDKILFDESTKEELRERANISVSFMKVILHKLRQSGIITNRSINTKYLPKWEKGKPFRWIFIFKNDN